MTAITLTWTCRHPDCHTTGTGPRSDREADKHTKTTGHPTSVIGQPQEAK